MSIPRLFKRRSRKSLASNEKSASAPPPPVPAVQFPTPDTSAAPPSNSSKGDVSENSSRKPSTLSAAQVPSMPEQATLEFPSPQIQFPVPEMNGAPQAITVTPASPTPAEVKADRDAAADAAVDATLVDVSRDIQQHRDNSGKIEQALNSIETQVSSLQARETAMQPLISPVKSILTTTGAMKTVEQGINGFMDSIPVLMKALDEVGKLHPFIGVVVLAFKAAYTLEAKRQANDKKVVALYVEMKDMIAVLVQLKTVKDEEEVGPDGITIKGRLQELVIKTAKDIKDCANTCNAYSKMKLLSKVLKGPLWEGSLANFVTVFTKRRTEFEFALSIHVGRGVDEANEKLSTLALQLEQKTDMIMQFLRSYVAPDQRELVALVDQKGGRKAVIENDSALKELNTFEGRRAPKGPAADVQRSGHARGDDLQELKDELREDPATVILNNFESFDRKFTMQQRLIVEELSQVVTRESDRVIETVIAGPHDKVVDRDLHAIWKDMGWRGSVKARHFVLTLRDFYREKSEDTKRKVMAFEIAHSEDTDAWTLEWLNVRRLQAIAEAFDDDASGYITITEANKLTALRPADWSLPHWLAYWAVGWQIMATQYRDKNVAILDKMFALRETVHQANRRLVDSYLNDIWSGVFQIMVSISTYYADEGLTARFQSYIDSEQERIRRNLESIRFDIDDLETVALVMGPGRIEKFIFPTLFLLLKRDLNIIEIAQTKVLHHDELWDSADTIKWVLDAFHERYRQLKDIFQQQELDLAKQFKTVSCELFDYWHNTDPIFTRENMREQPPASFGSVDSSIIENEELKAEDAILNYPLASDYPFACEAYNPVEYVLSEDDQKAEGPVKAVLGAWNCMLARGEEYPTQAMMTAHLHVSSSNNENIEATGVTPEKTKWTLTGGFETLPSGEVSYSFTMRYSARFDTKVFSGKLSEDGQTLSGTWGYGSLTDDPFIFCKLPPDVISFRPPPTDFTADKTKALWRFALTVTENQVRKKHFSWAFFKRRRDNRKRYLELLRRKWDCGHNLSDEENVELARCRQTLSTADALFYESIYSYTLRTTAVHIGIPCDVCGGIIGGTRTICMDCDTDSTVDICDDPRCLDSRVEKSRLPSPHLPTHTVYKVRTVVLYRDFGTVDRGAQDALQRARVAMKDVEEVEEEQTEGAVDMQDRTATLVKSKLACIVCQKRVTQPCWYCISCADDTFICLDCDPKDGVDVGSHLRTHPLVKCQDEKPEEAHVVSVEQELETLGGNVAGLHSKMTGMDDRMSRIEDMLSTLMRSSQTAPTANGDARD